MYQQQFHNSLEQQYDYANTMISNNAVQKSVERNHRRRMGQPDIPDSAKRERSRATCANGRRMRAGGDDSPRLVQLERLCVQAGL